jgi:hypothetical protein
MLSLNVELILNSDMKVSTLIPNSSYSSGTFSISFTAINSILTTPITAEDSVEKLYFGLLELLFERQKTGFVTQPLLSMEISNRAAQSGVFEETTGVFSNAELLSHLITFNFDSGPTFSGNNLHPTPP